MKYPHLVLGLVALMGIVVLLSSSLPSESNEPTPRYHAFMSSTGSQIYVYDAVTGEYEKIPFGDFKKGHNLKEFLEH